MEDKLIEQLKKYEDLCNCYAVGDILHMFADDGAIVVAGVRYSGKATLFDAHDFDRGNKTYMRLSNFLVADNCVTCAFDVCDELDRATGIDGWRLSAQFTFAEGKIREFIGLPPPPAEMARHQQAKSAFQMWAWKTCPDAWAKAFAFMPHKGFTGFVF
ncbi:MAG: hypothetical protein HC853_09065 [Anaerolineae bacterium]|nr:hypothetical protein [Anaerolineae bacterium]